MADILIIGAGPSSLILAYYCSKAGFNVRVVAPDIHHTWIANYCLWQAELPQDFVFQSAIEKVWNDVQICTQKIHSIPLPYVKFHSSRLQSNLRQACMEQGVDFIVDSIAEIPHKNRALSQRHTYSAHIIVDCTGSASPFHKNSSPHFQRAYGQLLEVESCTSIATLMDFRAGKNHSIPSFAYILPLSPKRIFIEETILCTTDNISYDELKNRLESRKNHMHLQGTVLEEEFCNIQMGGQLPTPEMILPFGSAGGFVHPVTGYQVGKAIAMAQKLAHHLQQKHPNQDAKSVQNAWNVLWSKNSRQNRVLYELGQRVLCSLNQEQTQQFFQIFFQLDPNLVLDFLTDQSTQSIRSAMWHVFRKSDWRFKQILIQHGITLFPNLSLSLSA